VKCAHGIVAVLGLTITFAETSAQGIVFGTPAGRGIGYPWGYSRAGRSLSLSGFYGGPYGFGYGSPFGSSSVTIIQPYVPRSTIIIVMPRESQSRDRDDRPSDGIVRIRPRREREREQERERDKEREREPEPEKINAPNPFVPRPQAELVPPPQLLEQPRPRPQPPREVKPQPAEDPREASARHVDLGKDAFAAGEYGRAAFRFQKAADLAPDQALPHFLLFQSLVALGKYRDAVSAIHAGLALDPTWPATGARLAALYGPAKNELVSHLQQLSATGAAHPDDPVLLFLQGVVLWFDGRRDEARPLFEKAAPRVPDRRDIDRFLQTPR
jgi:hypothetical protein